MQKKKEKKYVLKKIDAGAGRVFSLPGGFFFIYGCG